MNDFTKEELNNLFNCLQFLGGLGPKIHVDDLDKLLNKIQSMIEDYCEHDWYYNQHGLPIGCVKCGEEYK